MALLYCALTMIGKAEPGPETVLPPLPDEQSVPFGKPVDGIALRLIAPAEVCPGQAINLTVQVKNLSQRERYLPEIFGFASAQHVKLEIKGPNGKLLKQSNRSEGPVRPSAFKRLKPNEVWRAEIRDIQGTLFNGQFQNEGNYTLTYTFNGPKLPATTTVGWRDTIKDGHQVKEDLLDEATQEQLAGAWSGSVTASPAQITLVPMKEQDLTVHEWGVFTVFNDQEYANLNRKAEWGDLPDFFYRQFPTQRLRWAPAAWDKPLIYFYSNRTSLKLEVSVKFVHGAPVVWWPAAAAPVDAGGIKSAPIPKFDSLAWSGWLGTFVPNHGGMVPTPEWITPRETLFPAGQWLTDARLENAALFTVCGSKMQRTAPWLTDQLESGRFVFYDGLVPSPDYLHCLASDALSATVKNAAAFPIRRLYLLDRRLPQKPQTARTALGAAEEKKIDLAPAGDLAAFIRQIRADLIEAGLFEAEADSLLKIWHQGFFANSGLVAFYLLPREEYDAMLVLRVAPEPAAAPTRVGIALHPNFDAEPAITVRVTGWITQLDADDFKTREEAERQLTLAGPVALRLLQQAANDGSAEVKISARKILDAGDAGNWLK